VPIKKVLLEADDHFVRIDHFLCLNLTEHSRSRLEKIFRGGGVSLNGKIIRKKNHPLKPGDLVGVEWQEQEKEIWSSEHKLVKLYEDEYLLIIDKPAGLAVHPAAPGSREQTLVDLLLKDYPNLLASAGDSLRPGIIHRLDRETSGVLLIGLDERTVVRMQKKFARRQVEKVYLALVEGRMRFQNGTIDIPIGKKRNSWHKREAVWDENRNDSRSATTDFSVLLAREQYSLVRLQPTTGRTHQLRVHLAHFGNPVLGDKLYGKAALFPRLALHAYEIRFHHPYRDCLVRGKSPLPPSFRSFIAKGSRPKQVFSP